MSLDLELIFPIRDIASADLMMLKASCLWNAGIIDDRQRELVQRQAERFLPRDMATAAPWVSGFGASSFELRGSTAARAPELANQHGR